ncbi:MAG: hypothetical protein SGPRY_008805 [Prymnesium sp.]
MEASKGEVCSLQVSLASALSDLGEFEEERPNIQQIRPLRHKVEQLSQHAERLVTALSARDAQVRFAWALRLTWGEGEEILRSNLLLEQYDCRVHLHSLNLSTPAPLNLSRPDPHSLSPNTPLNLSPPAPLDLSPLASLDVSPPSPLVISPPISREQTELERTDVELGKVTAHLMLRAEDHKGTHAVLKEREAEIEALRSKLNQPRGFAGASKQRRSITRDPPADQTARNEHSSPPQSEWVTVGVSLHPEGEERVSTPEFSENPRGKQATRLDARLKIQRNARRYLRRREQSESRALSPSLTIKLPASDCYLNGRSPHAKTLNPQSVSSPGLSPFCGGSQFSPKHGAAAETPGQLDISLRTKLDPRR